MEVTAASVFSLPPDLAAGGYVCRSETDADTPFLMRLYGSTREAELALAPWSPEQKAAFVTQQFLAQRRHYRGYGASCAFLVIEKDGAPIGRLYLDADAERIHLVDISLTPDARGAGLGARLLRRLQDLAAAEGKRIDAFVEQSNRARRLYRRLGFVEGEQQGFYIPISWAASKASARPRAAGTASRSSRGAVAAAGGNARPARTRAPRTSRSGRPPKSTRSPT